MTEHCRRRGGGFQPLVSSMDERENWQIVLEREGMSFRRSLTFVFFRRGRRGDPHLISLELLASSIKHQVQQFYELNAWSCMTKIELR